MEKSFRAHFHQKFALRLEFQPIVDVYAYNSKTVQGKLITHVGDLHKKEKLLT